MNRTYTSRLSMILLAALLALTVSAVGLAGAVPSAASDLSRAEQTAEVDAARYAALGRYYTRAARAADAATARYQALADYYLADSPAARASTARYQALAAYYLGNSRGANADAARYQALVCPPGPLAGGRHGPLRGLGRLLCRLHRRARGPALQVGWQYVELGARRTSVNESRTNKRMVTIPIRLFFSFVDGSHI
ncbi:MAG: hypothetical protein P8129_25485 [Anaerolineae bacterium]